MHRDSTQPTLCISIVCTPTSPTLDARHVSFFCSLTSAGTVMPQIHEVNSHRWAIARTNIPVTNHRCIGRSHPRFGGHVCYVAGAVWLFRMLGELYLVQLFGGSPLDSPVSRWGVSWWGVGGLCGSCALVRRCALLVFAFVLCLGLCCWCIPGAWPWEKKRGSAPLPSRPAPRPALVRLWSDHRVRVHTTVPPTCEMSLPARCVFYLLAPRRFQCVSVSTSESESGVGHVLESITNCSPIP